MTTTNSLGHVVERFLLGFAGSTLVVAPPALSWYDVSVYQPSEVQVASFGFGVVLVVVWALSIYACTRETEPHLWGPVLKGAGLPAVLVAIGQVGQIVIK